jgi:hypothetical protein
MFLDLVQNSCFILLHILILGLRLDFCKHRIIKFIHRPLFWHTHFIKPWFLYSWQMTFLHFNRRIILGQYNKIQKSFIVSPLILYRKWFIMQNLTKFRISLVIVNKHCPYQNIKQFLNISQLCATIINITLFDLMLWFSRRLRGYYYIFRVIIILHLFDMNKLHCFHLLLLQ